MGNTYSVYMHENNINHKKYIGLTKREPALRWQNGTAYRNNKHFDAAIRKYGWNNFMHTVLETGLTHDEACEKEKYYIKKFNTTNRECGYKQTYFLYNWSISDRMYVLFIWSTIRRTKR